MTNKPKFRIPLSNVDYGALEDLHLQDAWKHQQVSGVGNAVKMFEKDFAATIGRAYGIATANGTLALEVVMQALGLGEGSEVLVPALTFVSPAAALRRLGARPVFVDIDEESWTIDPAKAAKQITPRTEAVVAVDVLGHPCNYEQLGLWLGDKLMLIEDAAESHGATYQRWYTGCFGSASIFSFYPNKSLSTGEGGMILTDDDELAEKCRRIVNHGMTPDKPYYHEIVGTNARLGNLHAAIGLAQTERFVELTEKRQQVSAWYRQKIDPEWHFGLRPVASWAKESCWLFTLTHSDRDRIVAGLRDQGIESRPIFIDLPSLPLYAESARGEYPVARRVSREAFWLPTSSVMTERDVDTVVAALAEIISELPVEDDGS